MKKILILGAPEFQIPLIAQAKRMGLYTCTADWNPGSPGIALADEYFRCSLKDSAALIELAEKIRPDAVCPGMCDAAVYSCALIAKRLGLPGMEPETALRATDKGLMVQAFEKYGAAHPDYFLLKKGASTEGLSLELPLITKPADMAGSRGVRLSRSFSELEENIKISSDAGDSGDIVLEEYVQGPEFSVELLILKGRPHVLQVTEKLTSGPPCFMELGHVQPAGIDEKSRKALEKTACEGVLALGLENCPAHAEIILSPKGPKIVEIGARMGGGGIQQQLLYMSAGINMPELAIRLALGEEPEPPERKWSKAAAVLFVQSRPGRLKSIEGLEEAKSAPGIKYAGLLARPGRSFSRPEDNSGRLAYVMSRADRGDQALEYCQAAAEKIRPTFIREENESEE